MTLVVPLAIALTCISLFFAARSFIADAPGFALGVQWHAEYDPQHNPINRALFQAFGEALTAHQRLS